LVVSVAERIIDKKGQYLIVPELEIEGWWTRLQASPRGNHPALSLSHFPLQAGQFGQQRQVLGPAPAKVQAHCIAGG